MELRRWRERSAAAWEGVAAAEENWRMEERCVRDCINKEKRQAFVEFLTPEDATTALSFDGRSLNGYALKIRRPKEYIEMTLGAQTESAEEVTLVSDTVADSPHKIFVAGISEVISSEMLMEIVSAFGPLAAYRFLFNKELGGPCAFVEYMDPAITPKACAGLSGMKLGGRVLTAIRAFTHSAEVDNEATPFYGIPDNAKSLLEEPTKVLQLKDMLYDMANICRFGAVKSVNIVELLSGNANTAEGKALQPEGQSIKIEPTELGDHDNSTEAASECSVPNQSVDVPYALCEDQAPADLDGTDERAALPTSQQVEADHKVPEASAHEDKHMKAAEATVRVDDDAVEKGLVDSIGSETCMSTTFVGKAEKSGRENKELGAEGAGEDHKVKASAVETGASVGAFVFEPGSILVEFTREEAACMAAHSLHGRRFGNRTVSVRYAPHDLYLQKYPK
ncbi:hypothetical protein PR202_gb18528 [Eleusine coracana subsp. coracana]|uniref:RRM domain-containing protein n=1 Tax=Eleusine coracana subsp. coracana TaxID=191504 RepID=A0AAV5F3J7_ELECO|nr:hypothetical protein PR202_gb18528 [Eleusine coracana subsp. coracana]